MGTWHSKAAFWAIVACGILSTCVLLAGQICLIVQRLCMSGLDRARREADTVVVVMARYPRASAEEVERQVTIPLEVTLAGMPGLKVTRSQSRSGLAHLRLEFAVGIGYDQARQEVINRLQFMQQLPAGVNPRIPLAISASEILRYTLRGPRDLQGMSVYSAGDFRALQDWMLARELRLTPGVAEVIAIGGRVKRYEVQPDVDRLRRYGITLLQLQNAIVKANGNIGGDYVNQGRVALNVRAVGLLGGGEDPMQQAVALKDPRAAAALLRAEEDRRLREIRRLVIATINGVPVCVEDVVDGGRLGAEEDRSHRGVVIGHDSPVGMVGIGRAGEPDDDDVVQGIVFLLPGANRQDTLRRLRARIDEFSGDSGRLLPEVRIEPFYERTGDGPAHATGTAGGMLWLRASFPVNSSVEEVARMMRTARAALLRFPECRMAVSQIGGGDDGSDPAECDSVQTMMQLRPEKDWPTPPGRDRARTRSEFTDELQIELTREFPGIAWEITKESRIEFEAGLATVSGEHLLKIFETDLNDMERLAEQAKLELAQIEGIEHVFITRILGRASLDFRIDREKCKRWGISEADLQGIIAVAVASKRLTQMVEGEKTYDIVLRWPEWMRGSEMAILDIPVDVSNSPAVPGDGANRKPAQANVPFNPVAAATPRLRLRDLVSPVGADGHPDPQGQFLRLGAAAIYREQGKRFIAVRFQVRGRDEAVVVAEAKKKLTPMLQGSNDVVWSSAPKK